MSVTQFASGPVNVVRTPFDPSRRSKEVDDLLRRAARSCPTGELAIVAVGGYGRGRLFPYSDIDLLLLHADSDEADLQDLAKTLIYPLWDEHFRVGYSFRTVEECLSDARGDISLATALVSSRIVSGSRLLFAELTSALSSRLFKPHGAALIHALEESVKRRWSGDPGPGCSLEPDLKNGRGALRDIESIDWALAFLGIRDRKEAVGYLSRREIRLLGEAERFLTRARGELQKVAGRQQDRLTGQYRSQVAELLLGGDGKSPRLVADLCRHTRRCFMVALNFWSRLSAGTGQVEAGPFTIKDPAEALFALDELALSGEPVPAVLLDAVSGLRAPSPARRAGDVRRALTRLLSRGQSALGALETAAASGLLSKAIPGWRSIENLPVGGYQHIHTVDAHSYLTAAHVADCLAGKWKSEERLADGMAREISHTEELLLAALLHDLGKGHVGSHALAGSKPAQRAARELGMSEESAALVGNLVRDHLLLIETAVSRDIADSLVVSGLADRVPDSEYLRMLYLLTVADSLATGPNVWNKWKSSLVSELFFKTLHWLEADEPTSILLGASDQAMSRLVEDLSLTGPRKEAESYAAGMPARYFSRFSTKEIVSHFQLFVRVRRGSALEWFGSGEGAAAELTLVSAPEPGLFAAACGALALRGANIVAAEAFNHADGSAVMRLSFQPRLREAIDDDFWPALIDDLRLALSGGIAMGARLAAKAARYRDDRRGGVEVRTDNDASASSTVLEVRGQDRVGLLWAIAAALEEMKLEITLAIISTSGSSVLDVFYVRDVHSGAKITSEARLKEIAAAIQFAVG